MMIRRYNEIGEIPYEYSSNLKLPLSKDIDKATRINLVDSVLDSWVKWATSIKDLYAKLIEEDSEYKATWIKMYSQAQIDLEIANKFHKKYYIVPRTKNVRMEMQAKLNAARNASA